MLGIDPLELREGSLPPRVLGLVMEWAEMHQAELMKSWTSLAAEGRFGRIPQLSRVAAVQMLVPGRQRATSKSFF